VDVTPFLELKPAPYAVFDRLAERRDRVRFHRQDGSAITWGAYACQIRRMALALAERGVEPGERVAIFAPNAVEWMSAAMAIQSIGATLVPIYAGSTLEQARYIVEHSGARLVMVDQASRMPGAPILSFADALTQGHDDERAFGHRLAAVTLDQDGLLLYTSGTSGPPKGVPLTHRNVAVNGADWLRCMAPLLDEGSVDLLWLPMSHIFGLGEASLGNALGWTTWLADPATVLTRLPEVRPDVFMSVPRVWEKLAAAGPERLAEVTGGRLRFCLSGGAGLPREVKELFARAGVLLLEGYGLTECSPSLTLNRPDAYRFDSVGRPVPSVELRLALDGEIQARGPSVFRGYHRDEAATREAFTADGWFKTGDIGRLTEDGFLRIVDRKKDILVTSGGKNVPPANIEARFLADPAIAHAVVYGDGKPYLVAGLWPATTGADRESFQRIVDRVNAELPGYETIKRFAIVEQPLSVEAGLLTPTLKVRRKQVYQEFRELFEGLYR
jgi:long-chain acyl-CoA synthetase